MSSTIGRRLPPVVSLLNTVAAGLRKRELNAIASKHSPKDLSPFHAMLMGAVALGIIFFLGSVLYEARMNKSPSAKKVSTYESNINVFRALFGMVLGIFTGFGLTTGKYEENGKRLEVQRKVLEKFNNDELCDGVDIATMLVYSTTSAMAQEILRSLNPKQFAETKARFDKTSLLKHDNLVGYRSPELKRLLDQIIID